MSEDEERDSGTDAASTRPTRRDYLVYGGAIAAGGLLAGCAGSGGEGTTDPGRNDGDGPDVDGASDGAATPTAPPATGTDTPTVTPTASETSATASGADTGTTGDSGTQAATGTPTPGGPYTATLAPAGEVTFESVPGAVYTNLGHHSEMALALGRGGDVNATYAPGYVDSLVSAFTARLEGVSVDWADLTRSWGASAETLYELDSDVHLADPATVVTMEGWDRADVADVAENVGPWFGNTYSDQHRAPPDEYADAYRHYPLWEIFGRVADALRERNRYEALRTVRDEMLATVEADLPSESERPSVAMVLHSTSGDGMWAYDVNAPGFHASHTRPFGATNALDAVGSHSNGDQIDYETLLAADPDVILTLGGVVEAHDMATVRANLEDDPVASQVTAVDEGRVHAQGTRHQGPLVNLFQLEMTAKQLYPGRFGEWPTYESGPYPALSGDERLFDHDRVASVIADGV
mgnify:CR=1 FL=1